MDGTARDQLIRNHLPLVRRVSEHLRASWRESGIEIDDLVACGTVGLIQAADRFDPTRGVSFKTYAELVIKGAIRDGVGHGANWFGRPLSTSKMSLPMAGRIGSGNLTKGSYLARRPGTGVPFSNRPTPAI